MLRTFSLAAAGFAGLGLLTPTDDETCCGQSCEAAPAAALVAEQTGTIVAVAKSTGAHGTLVQAVVAAGLVDALSGDGPLTVFAPTDEAFAKLPAGTLESLLKPENKDTLAAILTYHVVPGAVDSSQATRLSRASSLNGQSLEIEVDDSGLSVAGARVTQADVRTSNGIIHVVDTVMLPSTDDLIDTAVGAGDFGTLATALKTAGLIEALKGDGPFTVFAPTDAAFAKLPEGTVAGLLKPENKAKLTDILTYHVVPGRLNANQLAAAASADTLQGGFLRFGIDAGRLQVNGVNIVGSDVETTNGVIHVIDEVLLP
jgi:transforming growth factor-beta-induced protein